MEAKQTTTVMESNKTPEQLFIEEHPEAEKFYVLRYDYDESDTDYRKCMLERPTNEEVDKALDGFAQSMCHYHKMSMRMDLVETKVTDTGLVETVLYTKERTVNGKQ